MLESKSNEKYREPLLMPVYYKKKWVHLPLRYIPLDAIGKDGVIYLWTFTLIDEEGNEGHVYGKSLMMVRTTLSITRVLEPKELAPLYLKKLCDIFEIPIAWVTGKYTANNKRIKQGVSKNNNSKLGKKNYRDINPLSAADYGKWILVLNKINKPAAIVAEILWFLNESLQEGTYVSAEEVLRLRASEVIDDGTIVRINLLRHSNGQSYQISHYVPDDLGQSLVKLADTNEAYLFINKFGVPLALQQINKYFQRAGVAIGINNVSSLSLRAVPEKFLIKPPARLWNSEITNDEWNILIKNVPGIESKRGPKPKYDRRHILNAILYHVREGVTLRKLPFKNYPPYSAIEAQYRRWKNNKIMIEILEWLQSSRFKH